jgi:hypothetical protein
LKNIIKYSRHFFEKINRLPFIHNNSFEVNIIILLGAFAFIVIGVDLNSELAVEKNEIEYVVAVLENTNEAVSLSDLSAFIFNLSLNGVLPIYIVPIQTSDILSLPRDRSPPVF